MITMVTIIIIIIMTLFLIERETKLSGFNINVLSDNKYH